LIMFHYDDASMLDLYTYGNLKEDLLKTFPELFANILKIDDMNIEGLSIDSDGGLLIGFRSPLQGLEAIIIKIQNPEDLFLKKAKIQFSQPLFLDLHGLGIRDITYDAQKGGYWIIAGDVNERGAEFKLYFWDKKTNTTRFVENQPDIGFAEGVVVIPNGKDSSLFIVDDDGKKPNRSADYITIKRDSL